MSIARSIKRKGLRKQVGQKNMQLVWEQAQREKYGDEYKGTCKKSAHKYLLDPLYKEDKQEK